MVIWIIGLSGSGKTFLSKKIFKKLNGKKILVDGDVVRKYLTYDLGYTKKDREKNTHRGPATKVAGPPCAKVAPPLFQKALCFSCIFRKDFFGGFSPRNLILGSQRYSWCPRI